MKSLPLTMILLLAGLSFAADVFNNTTYDKALEISKEEDKPLLIKFDAKWCSNCRQMDSITFADERVITKLEQYVPVKVDVDTKAGYLLADSYKVFALPTIIVLDQEGSIIHQHTGYQDPGEFLKAILEMETAVQIEQEAQKTIESGWIEKID